MYMYVYIYIYRTCSRKMRIIRASFSRRARRRTLAWTARNWLIRMYMYIYIYIYREREMYIYIYIGLIVVICCYWMYLWCIVVHCLSCCRFVAFLVWFVLTAQTLIQLLCALARWLFPCCLRASPEVLVNNVCCIDRFLLFCLTAQNCCSCCRSIHCFPLSFA